MSLPVFGNGLGLRSTERSENMDIRMLGAYSGIDMSVIEQLMEAEAARGVRFTNQKENYTQAQNAWKDLNTRLDTLYKHLDTLQNPETFESKTVSTSREGYLSVSANTDAALGEYRIQVQQLATQTRLSGSRVETESIYDELDLEGSFTIESDGESFTFEVNAEDSLRDVMDRINDSTSDTKVRANIVDNRLVLTHTEYGEKTLAVSGEAAGDLGLENIQTTIGQNALFTVDGLEVERSSNRIDDVIEGLTFNLTNVHQGSESDVVTVSHNTDKAVEAMQKLVEQYNSTMSYIDTQLDVGDPTSEDNTTGKLVGDGSIMRLQSSLRSMMTQQHDTASENIRGLMDLGIEIDRNGVASFDQQKFRDAVEEDPDDVSAFFYEQNRVSETVINEDGEEVTSTRTERTGFAHDMRGLVNEYISSSSGIIKNRTETYDRLIKDVNQRIEQFEERLEVKRDRYIRQFSALDAAMMQAESQLDFLYSQLGLGQS